MDGGYQLYLNAIDQKTCKKICAMLVETPSLKITTGSKAEVSEDRVTFADSVTRVSSVETAASDPVDSPGSALGTALDGGFIPDAGDENECNLSIITYDIYINLDDWCDLRVPKADKTWPFRGYVEIPRVNNPARSGLPVPEFFVSPIEDYPWYCPDPAQESSSHMNSDACDYIELGLEVSDGTQVELRHRPLVPEDLKEITLDTEFSVILEQFHSCEAVPDNWTNVESVVLRKGFLHENEQQHCELWHECMSLESWYSVEESVSQDRAYDRIVNGKAILGSETDQPSVEERVHPSCNTSYLFADEVPMNEIVPLGAVLKQEDHHCLVAPVRTHTKSRFNWIRRLFCFAA